MAPLYGVSGGVVHLFH